MLNMEQLAHRGCHILYACGQALALELSMPILQFSSLEPHVCCRLVYVRGVALTTAGIASSAHPPPPAGQQCVQPCWIFLMTQSLLPALGHLNICACTAGLLFSC